MATPPSYWQRIVLPDLILKFKLAAPSSDIIYFDIFDTLLLSLTVLIILEGGASFIIPKNPI